MIVCDACKQKVAARESELSFKSLLSGEGFPITLHLCPKHESQLAGAIRLVVSIFRSVDAMPNEERMKEWVDRIVPWTFDERGQRTERLSHD